MTVYLWELALGQTYSGTVAATVPTDAYSGMSGASAGKNVHLKMKLDNTDVNAEIYNIQWVKT